MTKRLITFRRVTAGIIFWIAAVFFLLLPFFHFGDYTLQHYGNFATALLHGSLALPDPHAVSDLGIFENVHYLVFGPAPVLLFLPFAVLGEVLHVVFSERDIQFAVVVGVFFLIVLLAERLGFRRSDGIIFAVAFCIASPFLGVALIPISSYFAHIFCFGVALLALYEWRGKRRWSFVGLCMALVFATRLTAGIGIIFFVLDILLRAAPPQEKARNLWKLLWPVVLTAAVLGLYNWVRFQSPFDSGYAFQALGSDAENVLRNSGMFAAHHVANNAWYLLFALPNVVWYSGGLPLFFPNPWGLSLFFTSPYLLYFFFWRRVLRSTKIALVTMLVVLFPILLWWSTGYTQYGYRFALDFLPFILFAFLREYKKRYETVRPGFAILVIAAALTNMVLALMLFLRF